MGSELRGADLNLWWQNRAAKRKETSQLADKLRQTAARLSQAAGAAHADPSAPPVLNETPESLTRLADEILANLQTVSAQQSGIDGARHRAAAELQAANGAVERAAQQRSLAEDQAAMVKAHQSQAQMQKSKQALCKLAAVAIFFIVMYVIAHY
jgi:hypothetical protein